MAKQSRRADTFGRACTEREWRLATGQSLDPGTWTDGKYKPSMGDSKPIYHPTSGMTYATLPVGYDVVPLSGIIFHDNHHNHCYYCDGEWWYW